MAVEINIPKPTIDYNDLENKPALVTNHSELTLDDGTNPHGTTASDVGLGNVDNTSDINKPISNDTQDALDLKANDSEISLVGKSNNYNDLDNKPTIPSITGLVPYTGANSDVDLGAYALNAKSVKVNGTGGAGKLGLKHQASNPTSTGSETILFAGSDGEPRFKNDGNAIEQFASRQWVNLQGFISNVVTALGYTPEDAANKGIANGYAPLNSITKIDLTYFPDVILGQLLYGGVVNISTVSATLTNNAKTKLGTALSSITLTNNTNAITGYVANEGIYYIVTTAGTFASITCDVGDWLISIGSAWAKVDNTDAIASFNGRTGAITLLSSDITGALGYTPGTITSVSGTLPISSSGGTTPVISIATANASTTGALTSTDWNTFNNKRNNTVSTTGVTVSFTTSQIYNSVASPATGNITDNLTGASIGIVQKLYHNDSIAPTFPAGWVKLGSGSYTTSSLNIIYAEWVSGTRVEYWIVKGS